MKPLPTRVESAWLLEGPATDPIYLMHVRCVTEAGVWRVYQRIAATGEKGIWEWPTEAEARAHLGRIYRMGEEYGGAWWKVTRYESQV